MIPIPGHELKRASADCFLCACGMAFLMCPDQRQAEQRHRAHLAIIRDHRVHVKDQQKANQQSDFDAGNEQHWTSPFRKTAWQK